MKNITEIKKGLSLDTSLQNQPKGSYTFALNSVNETNDGDIFFNSNEESNEVCGALTLNYTPTGKVYVGNGETVIFSVSDDDTTSEIGIVDTRCVYTVLVNADLGFKVAHQIDATFRLRLGCERMIYWVDGLNKPRLYNIDRPELFKTLGVFDSGKFDLTRSYRSIPNFDNVQVLNSGGQLEPGSYNISIQYVDENLNSTEWISTTNIINIYNDSTSNDFLDINGSINLGTTALDFPTTSKSIQLDVSNLDTSFLFYRLAFIEATSGNGQITNVRYSTKLPTSVTSFTYTGTNYETVGSEEEILFFDNIITSADSIEQVENRLVLANTKGKQVEFCGLQRFASKIKADLITKEVFTEIIEDTGNTKNPMVHFNAVGYMPGEVYSFGIVYVFEDGSVSPAYHIPGKNHTVQDSTIFDPAVNTFPMSKDNENVSTVYADNTSCVNGDYWGVDSEGDTLLNAKVRHHRFPLRSSLGIPLVEEAGLYTSEGSLYQLQISITGTIDVPCIPDENEPLNNCGGVPEYVVPFKIRVNYTVDGVATFKDIDIIPENYGEYWDEDQLHDLVLNESTQTYNTSSLIVTSVEEIEEDGSSTVLVGTSPKGLDVVTTVTNSSYINSGKTYKTQVYGIKFSGVDLPPTSVTGGEVIVGYNIVRNERLETDKTILDSAVLTPTVTNKEYISHGLLGPEMAGPNKTSQKVFGLIHPEHKFNGVEYSGYDVIQEGVFNITDRKKSKARYLDVQDGTSWTDGRHTGGDEDGWSIKTITRDNILEYTGNYNDYNLDNADIESSFYLDALQSKNINDGADRVFNIAADNKVGILELKNNSANDIRDTLPYVYLKRALSDSYSTFRTLPYYKVTNNVEDNSVVEVFGGDTYVTPMRYTNTMFWENKIPERPTKRGLTKIFVGLAFVGAALAVILTGGLAAIPLTLAVAGGTTIIGGGLLLASSGIKQESWRKAYEDEYEMGLKETTLDDWVQEEYVDYPGSATRVGDDEIQWIGDCITNMWVESKVNTSLRYKMTSDVPTFLDAPARIEEGRFNQFERVGNDRLGDYLFDVTMKPFTTLGKHVMDKLVGVDSDRVDNKAYLGLSLGEWYEVNPDYHRMNKQKVYFHLGLEYDCCSDCQECFPHRITYSEQSFQEELSDNFKVFLPNNYKDIEGETGSITDLFRLKTNLYVHTEEALWHLPANYQERITDDIVSFIGTGEYFSIPPRKISDSPQSSAGCTHKWATLKTKYGVLFISEKERKVFLFNGNELKVLSDLSMSNWFKENLELEATKQYYLTDGEVYPYDNNPSNPFGVGFLSTYDTKKERLLITKKDASLSSAITGQTDFNVCGKDGVLTIFNDYQQTIDTYEGDGWVYLGLEDCRMKFERALYTTVTEQREVTVLVKNDTDIVVQLDMSGSFSNTNRTEVKTAVNAWLITYQAANPDWIGNLYYGEYPDSAESQKSWKILNYIQTGTHIYTQGGVLVAANTISDNIIAVTFTNENSKAIDSSFPGYHLQGISNPTNPPPITPNPGFATDYADFVSRFNTLIGAGGSFRGLVYPIVYTDAALSTYVTQGTLGYLQHVMSALKGIPYTNAEVSNIPVNPFVPGGDWTTLTTALEGVNPYPDVGFDQYNWIGKFDRGWDGTGVVLTEAQFEADMNEFILSGTLETDIIDVDVQVLSKEIEYVDGTPVEYSTIDNSWTMSYSFKANAWASWHSYKPNFYYHLPESFSSWIHGDRNFWKHGKVGQYQTYYDTYYPYTIEYVSLSNALQTRVWNDITLHTEAKKHAVGGKEFIEERFKTFNKLIAYNSRQCTGEINLAVKDTNVSDVEYLKQQVVNVSQDTVIIDKNEKVWHVNDLRDIRIDYDQPIFELPTDTISYPDRTLHTASLDILKDWRDLESFRDKYLVVRLIFDNFDDVKLILNYSVEDETLSQR